jgi:hypothetical protein
MRRDDIRRFCIPCSEETGYLVERHAPALERKRAGAKAQRQEREQARRQRAREQRAAREVIDGVDVGKEIARLIKLPALRDELPARLRGKPVSWTLDRSNSGGYSGRAWSRDRIHLTLGDIPASEVRAIICHELAHYALPYDVKHTGVWQRCYARVVREAYGVDVRPRPTDSKYDLDRRVIMALGGTGDHEMEEENGG